MYGLQNIWVAAPTKLTLVPPMAQELAERVAAAGHAPRRAALPRLASGPVNAQQEMWEGQNLIPLDAFCARYGLRMDESSMV